MLEQRFRVYLILIRLPVFPAAKQDSDPLVCQSTNCGVVTLAALPEEFVMGFGPLAPATRMIGEFLKCLSHEFRTRVSPMHETLFATLLGNRCECPPVLAFPLRLETDPDPCRTPLSGAEPMLHPPWGSFQRWGDRDACEKSLRSS